MLWNLQPRNCSVSLFSFLLQLDFLPSFFTVCGPMVGSVNGYQRRCHFLTPKTPSPHVANRQPQDSVRCPDSSRPAAPMHPALSFATFTCPTMCTPFSSKLYQPLPVVPFP